MSDVHDGDGMHDDRDAGQPPDPRTSEAFWIEALGGGRVGRSIVQDREVRAAIAGGRYRALYKLLRKRRKTARSREETAALDDVLSRRRAFLEPIPNPPGVGSWWGFGTNLQGTQETDPGDGTYITTYFLTALGMPVWPLKHFLVRDVEGGGWQVLGRVPMSPKVRFWRAGAAAAAVVLVAFIGWLVWRAETHDDVHVLNALPESVVVSIGGHRIPVPSGGRVVREIPGGVHEVVVTGEDGREIERETIDVDGGHDLAVYNVLGAAPLYVEEFGYGQATLGRRLEGGVSYLFLAGRRWVTRKDVEHVFESEPEEIRLDRYEKGETRLVAGMHGGGVRATLRRLDGMGRSDEARAIADRVHAACPSSWSAGNYRVLHAVQAEGSEAARQIVEAWIEHVPGSVRAHRHRQDLTLAGEDGERERPGLIASYRAAHEAEPGDADKAYLLARLLPNADALALVHPLLEKHPDHPWLHLVAGWNALVTGDYAAAEPHYAVLQRLMPYEEGGYLTMHVRCLAGLGRRAEALDRLRDFLAGLAERRLALGEPYAGAFWLEVFGAYGLLRWRLPGAEDEPTVLALLRPELDEETDEHVPGSMIAGWARAERHLKRFAPGAPDGDPRVAQARLEIESWQQPDTVHLSAALAPPEVRTGVDTVAAIAILASFARAGRLDEAEDLLAAVAASTEGRIQRAQFEALPSLDGIDAEIGIDVYAAMLLAASKAAPVGDERARLLAAARRFDPLRRIVRD